MNLKKIKAEDLLFTYEIEDDRTNTYLTLNDYDWMDYKLETRFKTKEQGTLDVLFQYFGVTFSIMKVKQTINNTEEEVEYEFSSDIFQKYIIKFLEKHISQWKSKYAFNGEDIVIEFFNEVLENMTEKK